MDLNSLKDQVSNLTLYDLKAGVRKVQNAVMNYTEMESKVREATNNEPWGASSSLMQEIANGTHSYQLLCEIMPLIYKRFTDKTAEEWRQIYKSLQLLEYLIKNGSERVIDDARQHVSLLRMLRQFHFIDEKGKDQGVNVRNRAQELAKLLSDVDAIRSERKKARANRSKYAGVEGGAGMGGGFSGGSRYGGYGNEDAGFGGYRGEVYGDGGGFGGNTSGFSDTQRRTDKFEEYDEDEDGGPSPSNPPGTKHLRAGSSGLRAASLNTIKRDAKIKQQPQQDLFDFGEEPTPGTSNGKGLVASPDPTDDFGALQAGGGGDDDFDDFQSATTPGVGTEAQRTAFSGLASPPTASSTLTPAPSFGAPLVAPAPASNLNDLFSSLSPGSTSNKSLTSPPASSIGQSQRTTSTSTSTPYNSSGPNYFTSVQSTINNPQPATKSAFSPQPQSTFSSLSNPTPSSAAGLGKPTPSSAATLGKPTPSSAPATKPNSDAFGSLWSTASATAGVSKTAASKGPDLASLAKKKNEEAMWGAPSQGAAASAGVGASRPPATGQGAPKMGNGLDDLLG